jgi:FkbH-like protein
MIAHEPIRLVIWDLDETLWGGTLTEGGIDEVQPNYEIVRQLASRGIMSSICSKNEFNKVKEILVAHKIWDFFIFPSIDWSPKPDRVSGIIKDIQLRPETVLFLDDNHANRASVLEHNPGIRTEDEFFIPKILSNPLFSGKNDKTLSRLSQYKLLEKRHDAKKHPGYDHHKFLKESNIEVIIDLNVQENLERVVELINRTNQLNFTKKRLSDSVDTAIKEIELEINRAGVTTGLIKVQDKFGDYGYCGFYLIKWGELFHYCFSCRTLGFDIETWLFRKLGSPKIEVQGEVLTDIFHVDKIDWVNLKKNDNENILKTTDVFDDYHVVLRGSCEADLMFPYFSISADDLVIESGSKFLSLELKGDSIANLAICSPKCDEEILSALNSIGIMHDHILSSCYSNNTKHKKTLLVMFVHADFKSPTYKHKNLGIYLSLAMKPFYGDICKITDLQIDAHLHDMNSADAKSAKKIIEKIREDWIQESAIDRFNTSIYETLVDRIFKNLPEEAEVIIVTPNVMMRDSSGVIVVSNPHKLCCETINSIKNRYPNLGVINIGSCIASDEDIIDSIHYSRSVYFKLYEKICDLLIKKQP